MSDKEDAQRKLALKLSAARSLLVEAATIAEENSLGEIHFMGMVFEPSFGWFTPDGELQEESDWNSSACVIGSNYAEGYGMEGWKDKSSHRDRFGNRGR